MDMPDDRTREPDEQPADDGDFAEEHTSPTFADEMAGGPEGVEEPESPSGLGGMDPDTYE